MKTSARNLFMAIILMLAIVALPSCNDDDESSINSSNLSLIGTWEFRYQHPLVSVEAIIRLTFNKNGYFEQYTKSFEIEYDHSIGSFIATDETESTLTGKWSTSGNKLTIEGYDLDGEYDKTTTNYSIKGKELTIDSIEQDGTIVPLTFIKVK